MFLYALQNIVNMLKTAEFHWNFFAKFNIIMEDSVLVSSLFIIPVTVPGGGQEAAVRAVAPLCHELSLATSHSHQLSTRYRASAASLALTIHYNYDLWGKYSCATVTDAISRKRSQPSMLFCHHLLSHLWFIKGPKQYNYNRPSFSTIHFNLIKIRQCSAKAQMTSTEGHFKKI